MSWTEEKVSKLKELWGSGKTANQIAEIIGGISRNAVIGKAHRLNLSSKIKTKNYSDGINNRFSQIDNFEKNNKKIKKIPRSKFKSLLIEKDFEPENPKQLEELNDNSCKWPIGHPNESSFYFCGRTSLKDFSYCKLHLLYAFQPKAKKEDSTDKNNDEVPKYIRKKIKSA
jgi:GcrA cell cycle regulator|tara:strand:- start:67 stop:579 length:513 start_codon:yes stop_codon:yes gene_type:complete